jgi:hypothetical protein
MSACREARRLISRKPTRSPRLKLPLPCLNSQSGESGEPVWKTSLTVRRSGQNSHDQDDFESIPLWKPYMFSCRTKEEILVCLKYDLRHG